MTGLETLFSLANEWVASPVAQGPAPCLHGIAMVGGSTGSVQLVPREPDLALGLSVTNP